MNGEAFAFFRWRTERTERLGLGVEYAKDNGWQCFVCQFLWMKALIGTEV